MSDRMLFGAMISVAAFIAVAPYSSQAAQTTVAPVAPPASDAGATESAADQASSEPEGSAEDAVLLALAEAAADAENFTVAVDVYSQFLAKRGDARPLEKQAVRAYDRLAVAATEVEDYRLAIFALDRLSETGAAVENLYDRRGYCYSLLEREEVALDEMRLAVSTEPQNILSKAWLANLLVTGPNPLTRNGAEAQELLAGLDDQIPKTPLIALAGAAAAAELGDFDRAVKLERLYVAASPPDRKMAGEAAIEMYARETRFPFYIKSKDPLDESQLVERARHSVVLVRFRGRASHEIVDEGFCIPAAVERFNPGVVIDERGAVMVSAATTAPPPPGPKEAGKELRSTWVKGPFIDVFSLREPQSPPAFLGTARLVGEDPATGVAVVRLERQLGVSPVKGLAAVEFQPSYRVADPDANKPFRTVTVTGNESAEPSPEAEPAFDLPREPTAVEPADLRLTTIEIEQGMALTCQAADNPLGPPAHFACVRLPESGVRVGAPIFNAAGELAALAHRVVDEEGHAVVVGVPAATASRIVAKLLSYGEVRRAFVPFQVRRVAQEVESHGETQTLAGMEIVSGTTNDPAVSALAGHVILSVDGVRTPNTSAWLEALERASARRRSVVACEVAPALGEKLRTVEIAVRATASDASDVED